MNKLMTALGLLPEQRRPPESMTAFVCPACLFISHNLMDLAQGYCVRCHDWTRPPSTNA